MGQGITTLITHTVQDELRLSSWLDSALTQPWQWQESHATLEHTCTEFTQQVRNKVSPNPTRSWWQHWREYERGK